MLFYYSLPAATVWQSQAIYPTIIVITENTLYPTYSITSHLSTTYTSHITIVTTKLVEAETAFDKHIQPVLVLSGSSYYRVC